jgi:hypothetical protein
MENNGKKEAYQIGLYVFLILAVLTLGEYWLGAVGAPWTVIFFGIAILKAWFVIQNYMHLPRVFAGEEVEHDDQ